MGCLVGVELCVIDVGFHVGICVGLMGVMGLSVEDCSEVYGVLGQDRCCGLLGGACCCIVKVVLELVRKLKRLCSWLLVWFMSETEQISVLLPHIHGFLDFFW